jgi:NAD(P)-dependent dehydrogenase (short-subunit alcohol dehydrogenase family)
MASALGKMSFEDLDGSSAYSKWAAYGQSKLANLLFTFELAQRLGDRRAELRSIACHPGYAATNLQYVGPELEKSRSARIVMELGNNLLAQSAEQGALPTVFASVSPEAHSGEFIGPSGLLRRGPPKPGKAPRAAYDRASMQKLWQISSERTGVGFDALS